MERKYRVVVAYRYADKNRGDIISTHKTYEAAQRKIRQSTHWTIRIWPDDYDPADVDKD